MARTQAYFILNHNRKEAGCIKGKEGVRPPLDLLEAESELVSGHMTEYSGVAFAFFFLAEYSMMLFMGIFVTVLFFGFANPLPFLFFLYWIRASLPRVRIDHVLSMGWSSFLPFLTGYILV